MKTYWIWQKWGLYDRIGQLVEAVFMNNSNLFKCHGGASPWGAYALSYSGGGGGGYKKKWSKRWITS